MDAIQRKLAILDHVSPWQGLTAFLTQSCPLLMPALGLMLGILIQHRISLSPAAGLLGLLVTAGLVTCVAGWVGVPKRALGLGVLAGLSFACLGALRLDRFQRLQPLDMRSLIRNRPRMITLRGTVDSEPWVEQPNWTFAPVHHLDPATTFDLKADSLLTAQGWQPVKATVRVRIAEPVRDLKPFQRVELYGWLDRFGPAANPGQFDMQAQLARQNIHLWVSIKSRHGLLKLESMGHHTLGRMQYALRRQVSRALLADLPADSESQGLLQALLLGQRRDINADTHTAFKKTGLLHFISLSGLHMGILAALIWWLGKIAGLLKRGRAAICICAILLFMLVVPPRAPTLRAAIICWVFCLSFFFQRRPHSLNTLCLAALILLLAQPAVLFDAGWQLSFASVLGILLLAQPLYDRAHMALAALRLNGPWPLFAHPGCLAVGRSALSLLCVGLGAWLGGAGILLWHFYRITPVACVWTVLVFPVVAIILVLGFLKILLFFCLPWGGESMGWLLSTGGEWLIMMVKGLDDLGATSILVGRIAAGWIVFYYVAFFLIRYAPLQNVRLRQGLRWVLALVLLGGIGGQRYRNQHRSDLLLTCLDVGHGQAVVLQLPGKQNMLFDAGSLYRRDIGRRVVIPFLEYQGIDRLDQVIMSHNDTDHINGIPEIVDYIRTDHLSVPMAFSYKDEAGPALGTLQQWLTQNALALETLKEIVPTRTRVPIRILWPTAACRDLALTDNDRSLVALIEFAGKAILICSDIEQIAQNRLLSLYPDLNVDVLIAPHHGSLTTLAPDFLAQLRPETIICSCSRSQLEKDRVIRGQGGCRVLYTARHGALTVRVPRTGEIEITPHLTAQAN